MFPLHKTFVNYGISIMSEKITPETYEKMNKEFEEHGLAFRIKVPTQKEIDDWEQRNKTEYC